MLEWLATKTGMYVMAGIGAALLLLGAYTLGSSHGYASGYDSGYAKGQKSRQQEVDHLKDNVSALTKTINDERLATATKLQAVEHDATERALKTQSTLTRQITERDQIIKRYEKTVPVKVQESCGLSVETVEAINQLIDKANGVQNEQITVPDNPTDPKRMQQPTSEEGHPAGGRGAGSQEGDGQHSVNDSGTVSAATAPGEPPVLSTGGIGGDQSAPHNTLQ